jgi:glycosyltransferase involved in cell wall biosynthesis
MKISVIICTYRGQENLVEQCIKSLQKQTVKPDEIILVVDTEHERREYSQMPSLSKGDLSIIASGKKGLAAARNKGVDYSTGDIVAFIDDDAAAVSTWIEEIKRSFSSEDKVNVVGGPVKPIFEGSEIPEKFYWIIGCTSDSPPTSRPIGCNIAVKKDIFKKIGLFDERLGRVQKKLAIGEETDLILRIQHELPGSVIIFNQNAQVFHKTPFHRVTLGYFIKRAYEEGYSKALIRKKYPMQEEQRYLKYYMKNLDFRTLVVLAATGAGYVHGLLGG